MAGEGPKVVAGGSPAPAALDYLYVYFQTVVHSGRGAWSMVLLASAQ